MKLQQIALLCATVCAGFTGQAMAQVSGVPAAQTIVNEALGGPGVADDKVLFISGASAVQGGLGQIATTLFAGTSYLFHPNSASGRTASDHRAYAGRLAVAAGGWPAGTAVIVVNRARGGSVWGVNGLLPAFYETAQGIEALDVSVAGCAAGAGTSGSPFLCGLTQRMPDAGISDVAPNLFDSRFNTEGEPASRKLNATELGGLAAQPIYGLAFGVPVSDNLPLFFLNKPLLSSIMTGNMGTWDQVNASLPTDDVLICRRVNGSGSQAVANLYYGNYPCGAGNAPADRDSVPTFDGVSRTFVVEGGTGGLNVIENSTSGDVRACLNNAFDASGRAFVADGVATPGTFTISTNPTTGVKTGAWTGTNGYTTYVTADRAGEPAGVALRNGRQHKAIGVLSMDSLPNSTSSSKWTFRSINGAGETTYTAAVGATPAFTTNTGTGVFPDKASYMDGTWEQQGWISFNIPTARTTGNKLALANRFVAAAKLPTVLAGQVNLAFAAGALPGTDDPTNTGNVLKAGYPGNNQCAPLTR